MLKKAAVWTVVALCFMPAAWIVWLIYFADGTVYARGFSESGFRSVKVGMTAAQVKSSLGEPLNSYKIGNQAACNYTNWNPDRGERYKIREVIFDDHGRVNKLVSKSFVHND